MDRCKTDFRNMLFYIYCKICIQICN